MKRVTTLLILPIAAAVAHAHQDRIFVLETDGTITGLPPKYEPASLQVEFEEATVGIRVTGITLAIGSNQVKIPSCLTELVEAESYDAISIHGSWYHATEYLPEYIAVTFLYPGFDQKTWANSSYQFLFNLNTSKLVQVTRIEAAPSGRSTKQTKLPLDEICAGYDVDRFIDEGYEAPHRKVD